jgi:hypothetical protein
MRPWHAPPEPPPGKKRKEKKFKLLKPKACQLSELLRELINLGGEPGIQRRSIKTWTVLTDFKKKECGESLKSMEWMGGKRGKTLLTLPETAWLLA